MIKNYFEHFGLEVQFNIDEKALKKQFLQKSKSYHPDFYTQEGENAQNQALEMSSYNNMAYKTLKKFNTRYKYILSLIGVVLDEGQLKLPQSFLIEMMDFNESLMDAQMEDDTEKMDELKIELAKLKEEQKQSVQSIIDSFELSKVDEYQKEALLNFYLKTKYLDRIAENLEKNR